MSATRKTSGPARDVQIPTPSFACGKLWGARREYFVEWDTRSHPPSLEEKNPEIPIRWEIHTSLAGRLSLSLTTEFPEHGSGAPAQHEAPACFMALNTLYVQRAVAAQ